MKIVIPGGAGHLGQLLAKAFSEEHHEVVVLTRHPARLTTGARSVGWDARTIDPAWAGEIDGADVVINLAGRSVECRYNEANKRAIMNSRVESTHVLGEAIAAAAKPPRVWLNASSATIYAHTFGVPHDEDSKSIGGGEGAEASWQFSIEVVRNWEKVFFDAPTPATRRVAMRTSMVMCAAKGGAFSVLYNLARFGLGGAVCGGRQFMSWMHEHDFVRVVRLLIENESLEGIVNLAAPNPLPQREFMAALRSGIGMPIGLPAMRWQLELGAMVLGSEPELIVKSRRVISRKLADAGFEFHYPTWPEAARELCARMKQH